FYIESLFGLFPDQPPISASLPLGSALLAVALLAILALRLVVSLSAGAVISLCMFAGSFVSARIRMHRVMLEWPTISNILRRTLGGILMGLGARWQRYDTADWFPNGRMAGRARLRAARCVPCRTHRQIRFGGKVLVM